MCYFNNLSFLKGCYGADARKVSVGGFSSGATFSSHLFTILSSEIMGLAMFAGAPFGCGKATQPLLKSLITCAYAPLLPDNSIAIAKSLAAEGKIDPLSNMAGKPVFIFNLKEDFIVNPYNGKINENFYKSFGCDVATNFNLSGTHGMPSINYGCPCQTIVSPWINNCNYNGAYESLQHIYKNLQRPNDNFQYCPSYTNIIEYLIPCMGSSKLELCNSNSTEIDCTLPGEFYQYNQTEFTDDQSCFDSNGYVYVPSNCKNNTSGCRLHVASHGCLQARQIVCEKYVKHAGYLEVGEMNNIIILFPQIVSCVNFLDESLIGANLFGCHDWHTGYLEVAELNNIIILFPQVVICVNVDLHVTPLLGVNLFGCHDWVGYTGLNYLEKDAIQMVAFRKMVERIISSNCEI
ncbi:hypothetical protein CHUAL_011753 [Chamberlinius hualienensis]